MYSLILAIEHTAIAFYTHMHMHTIVCTSLAHAHHGITSVDIISISDLSLKSDVYSSGTSNFT